MNINKAKFDELFEYFKINRELFDSKFGKTVYKDILIHKDKFLKRLEHNYHVFVSSNKSSNDVILDFGCGWGFFVFSLACFNVKRIIGIDIREDEIKIAKKIKNDVFKDNEIEFFNGAKLDLSESVDCIYFNNVMSHVKLPIEYLYDAYRTLKYSGTLIVYDNNNGLSLLTNLKNRKLWRRNELFLTKEREEIFIKLGFNKKDAIEYSNLSNGLSEEDIQNLALKNRESIKDYLLKREKLIPTQFIYPQIVDERIINPILYKKILFELGFECIKITSESYNHPSLAKILNKFRIGKFILPAVLIYAEKRRMPISNY